LKGLFGGTVIDLDKGRHARVFFQILVRLLVAVDKIIATSLRRIPRRYRGELLGEWRVAGVAGVWDPVRLRKTTAKRRLPPKPLQPAADPRLPFE
jgi:hypothetical protein